MNEWKLKLLQAESLKKYGKDQTQPKAKKVYMTDKRRELDEFELKVLDIKKRAERINKLL